jgi:dTDP-4-dehydrorhamnose reductase
MTWLITGGSGQLGIALANELQRRGMPFLAPKSYEMDITLSESLSSLVAYLSPSIIVNCAAWTDVDAAEEKKEYAKKVNTDGAENIALAAKFCGAKLIQISTDYVFSGKKAKPWESSDIIDPQSVYGRTKADGEDRVLATYRENTAIVRTAWLYSPWGKNFAKTMTKKAMYETGVVRVVNDQVGQPTSVFDLAGQLVELGESRFIPGIYHGTNSGHATWFNFAQELFKLSGADVNRVLPIRSMDFPQKATRPGYSVLSHKNWNNANIRPLRDWRLALTSAMPRIVSSLHGEE